MGRVGADHDEEEEGDDEDGGEEEEVQPEVAVINRERRATAGKRMNGLVGKAIEDDDAFWGHETWAEDDSGNESFHESDEDSALRKDQFDSDFDDSESDHDEEEVEEGRSQEAELRKAERQAEHQRRKKGGGYVEAAVIKKKQQRGPKRVVGDGLNAGIVLNFPPSMASKFATTGANGVPIGAAPSVAAASLTSGKIRSATETGVQSPPSAPAHPPKKAAKKSTTSIAAARPRRAKAATRRTRITRGSLSSTEGSLNETDLANAASGVAVIPKTPVSALTPAPAPKKITRKRYRQEELLLEAVNKTEPENERWLLARKRVQDLAEQNKERAAAMLLREKARGAVVEKYHSRRGCLITLTFPSMDAVPELLSRQNDPPKMPSETKCVISGKEARYRDPKTKMGYHDAAAFKELRRRWEAGEFGKKSSPKKVKSVASPKPAPGPQTPSLSAAEILVSGVSPTQVSISVTSEQISPQLVEKSKPPSPHAPMSISQPTPALSLSSAPAPEPPPASISASMPVPAPVSVPAPAPAPVDALEPARHPAPASTKSMVSNGTKHGAGPSQISHLDTNGTNGAAQAAEGRRSKRKWAPSAKALQNLLNEGSPKAVRLVSASAALSSGKPLVTTKKIPSTAATKTMLPVGSNQKTHTVSANKPAIQQGQSAIEKQAMPQAKLTVGAPSVPPTPSVANSLQTPAPTGQRKLPLKKTHISPRQPERATSEGLSQTTTTKNATPVPAVGGSTAENPSKTSQNDPISSTKPSPVTKPPKLPSAVTAPSHAKYMAQSVPGAVQLSDGASPVPSKQRPLQPQGTGKHPPSTTHQAQAGSVPTSPAPKIPSHVHSVTSANSRRVATIPLAAAGQTRPVAQVRGTQPASHFKPATGDNKNPGPPLPANQPNHMQQPRTMPQMHSQSLVQSMQSPMQMRQLQSMMQIHPNQMSPYAQASMAQQHMHPIPQIPFVPMSAAMMTQFGSVNTAMTTPRVQSMLSQMSQISSSTPMTGASSMTNGTMAHGYPPQSMHGSAQAMQGMGTMHGISAHMVNLGTMAPAHQMPISPNARTAPAPAPAPNASTYLPNAPRQQSQATAQGTSQSERGAAINMPQGSTAGSLPAATPQLKNGTPTSVDPPGKAVGTSLRAPNLSRNTKEPG